MADIYFNKEKGFYLGGGENVLTYAKILQLAGIDQELSKTSDVEFDDVTANTFTTTPTVVDAATYPIVVTDGQLEVEYTSTGACAITLPDAQRVNGREIRISDTGGMAGTNNITIKDTAGSTLFVIDTDGDSYSLKSNKDNTKWYPF